MMKVEERTHNRRFGNMAGRRIYSQFLFAYRLQFQPTNKGSNRINNEFLFINLATVTG
jgi:hypothetical protein